MSFPIRFGFTVVVLSLGIAGVFHAAKGLEGARARSDYELCRELEREVGLSVDSELLTQEEADAIVQHCFNLFVK